MKTTKLTQQHGVTFSPCRGGEGWARESVQNIAHFLSVPGIPAHRKVIRLQRDSSTLPGPTSIAPPHPHPTYFSSARALSSKSPEFIRVGQGCNRRKRPKGGGETWQSPIPSQEMGGGVKYHLLLRVGGLRKVLKKRRAKRKLVAREGRMG